MSLKTISSMIALLFTLVIFNSAAPVCVNVAPLASVDSDQDVQPVMPNSNTQSLPASASPLSFVLLVNVGKDRASCNTCRRYLGFVACTQYPKGIPRVYIRGEKECSLHHERSEVTD